MKQRAECNNGSERINCPFCINKHGVLYSSTGSDLIENEKSGEMTICNMNEKV